MIIHAIDFHCTVEVNGVDDHWIPNTNLQMTAVRHAASECGGKAKIRSTNDNFPLLIFLKVEDLKVEILKTKSI
jgi:hypothetical protein